LEYRAFRMIEEVFRHIQILNTRREPQGESPFIFDNPF